MTATLLNGMDYDALQLAQAVAVCSGTATLEFCCLGLPMVVAYRTSLATAIQYGLLRGLLGRQRFAAMPNIIVEREIVPERLGAAATPESIADVVIRYLRDESARAEAEARAGRGGGGAGNPGGLGARGRAGPGRDGRTGGGACRDRLRADRADALRTLRRLLAEGGGRMLPAYGALVSILCEGLIDSGVIPVLLGLILLSIAPSAALLKQAVPGVAQDKVDWIQGLGWVDASTPRRGGIASCCSRW